jgi:hypothetical protein
VVSRDESVETRLTLSGFEAWLPSDPAPRGVRLDGDLDESPPLRRTTRARMSIPCRGCGNLKERGHRETS